MEEVKLSGRLCAISVAARLFLSPPPFSISLPLSFSAPSTLFFFFSSWFPLTRLTSFSDGWEGSYPRRGYEHDYRIFSFFISFSHSSFCLCRDIYLSRLLDILCIILPFEIYFSPTVRESEDLGCYILCSVEDRWIGRYSICWKPQNNSFPLCVLYGISSGVVFFFFFPTRVLNILNIYPMLRVIEAYRDVIHEIWDWIFHILRASKRAYVSSSTHVSLRALRPWRALPKAEINAAFTLPSPFSLSLPLYLVPFLPLWCLFLARSPPMS